MPGWLIIGSANLQKPPSEHVIVDYWMLLKVKNRENILLLQLGELSIEKIL